VITATEALQKLRDGNRRFVEDERLHRTGVESRRQELADEQAPFAVILGCSDSRVPAEIIFDQELGDLFVIRVAGNIVQPSQVGSIEFAAAKFGTRLVVVLGHSRCGAISATIDHLQARGDAGSDNLNSIVEFIRPSVEPLLDKGMEPDAVLEAAVRANVRIAVSELRHASPVIEELERSDGLVIVGAEYSLDSGLVDFFDSAT
jgi:carbonic anhydrase